MSRADVVTLRCLWRARGLPQAVRDVSKWSARMRAPMEAVYGARLFAQTWEAWVDAIAQFVHGPQGDLRPTRRSNCKRPRDDAYEPPKGFPSKYL